MRSRRPAVAAAASLALLGACGGDDDTGSPDTVVMKLIAFAPERLRVPADTTVTWRQQDPGVHTVTSGRVEQATGGVREVPDGRFDSGRIATEETFDFTFADTGEYPYYCAVHPATMRGVIRVT